MSKLKQSVAVQRQIPEHIKQNYPAFVEFVKLYYEFLEQTQSQNLESVRDIDTTLDEFISRFKLELAKNVPIDMSDDKRLLLKNIRQFYLSRGSEDSFKFIFKTLFGKEAELFYPSTQMLRVSDGKWQQEISVFVRMTGTTASLFPVSGKYIQIITPRKTIQAFAESVSAYNDLVYEIFIQRDYANEITVGSQINYVDANGTTYTGEILACPSKIKVYKPGKGFRVGQLFSLKTSIGNGCLVKITKVNSDGGIQAVQPIKFGLDYVSTFFSYLSSKSIQAYEYIHPLEIGAGQTDYEEYVAAPINGVETFNLNYLIENNVPLILVEVTRNNSAQSVTYTATNNTSVTITGLQAGDIVKLYGITTKGTAPLPNDPGYRDQYSDFIEYGFASKQTYMDYDTSIPVQLDSHASDRYFVDGSYVGDIVQQFYTDSTTGVFDDDLAIIQIDLGAVARYPGYYLKSDGFISDEMYIQDGSYYQAFSYVIRVEEEMRKYADIIRALVHPTGMKMFAEYNIFTHIIVSAGVPNIFRLLQFSDVIQNINDTSYNYDAYVYRANQDGTFDYVPPEDEQGQITAGLVFGRQNKAVLFPRKNISDATVEDYTISTGFTSNQEPVVFITNYKELYDKSVVKAHTEVIGEGYIAFSGADSGHLYYASPAENGDETYDISYRIVGNQPQIQVEVTRNGNTFTPTYTAIDETTVTVNELESGDIVKIYVIHEFAKNYDETYLKAMNKPVADSILENIVTTQGTDSLNQQHTFVKNYFETHVKSIEKAHRESITERLINLDSVNQTLPRNYDETIAKGVDKPFPMEYITERKVDSVGQDSAGTSYNFTKNYDETYSKSLDKRGYNTNPDDPNGIGFGRFDLTIPENYNSFTGDDSEGTTHSFISNYLETKVKSVNKTNPETIIAQFTKALNYIHDITKPHIEFITERLSNLDSVNQTLPRNYDETILKSTVKPHTELITERKVDFTGDDSEGTTHSFTYNYDETVVKNPVKGHAETISNNDSNDKAVDKSLTHSATSTDSNDKAVDKPLEETIQHIEITAKAVDKPFPMEYITERKVDFTADDSDGTTHSFTYNYDETVIKGPEKIHAESITERFVTSNIQDSQGTTYQTVRNYDETIIRDYAKNIQEFITERLVGSNNYDETIVKAYAKGLAEFILHNEEIGKTIDKRGYNTNPDDPNGIGFGRFDLTLFSTDSYSLEPNLIKSDFSTIDPFEDIFIQKIPSSGQGEIRIHEVTQPLIDNVFIAKAIFAYSQQFILDNVTEPYRDFVKNLTETLLSPDSLAHSLIKPFSDTLAQQTDLGTCNPNKGLSDSVPQTDKLEGHDIRTSPAETINTLMSGRIILNTYDDSSNYSTLTSYFVSDSNYRDSQVIS